MVYRGKKIACYKNEGLYDYLMRESYEPAFYFIDFYYLRVLIAKMKCSDKELVCLNIMSNDVSSKCSLQNIEHLVQCNKADFLKFLYPNLDFGFLKYSLTAVWDNEEAVSYENSCFYIND